VGEAVSDERHHRADVSDKATGLRPDRSEVRNEVSSSTGVTVTYRPRKLVPGQFRAFRFGTNDCRIN